MPYRTNIPQANQRINDTQPLILQNFALLNQYFGNNHITFNAGADWGKHTLVKFFSQGAFPANDPAAIVGTTEKWLYNLTYKGNPELFVRTSTTAAGSLANTPMTAKLFTSGTRGWTFLPSGIVLKFGTGTSNGGNVGTINLNEAPFYDDVHYISIPFAQVTAFTLAGPSTQWASVSNATTAAQLICHTRTPNSPFSWFTIGVIA